MIEEVKGGAKFWCIANAGERFTRIDLVMELERLKILRIGFYEIVKLEMPPYAVVDENVKLAKVALRPGAGNMVNAVVKKLVLLKETESLPSPNVEGDNRQQARALAIIHPHPVWMVRRWENYIGLEEAITQNDVE